MEKYFRKLKKCSSRINIHNGGQEPRADMAWKNLDYGIENKLESLLDYREKPKEIKIKKRNASM